MNKKSHKKKKRRAKNGCEKDKENIDKSSIEKIEEEKVVEDKDLCYEVKTSEVMGRYLVARREVAAGEVVMRAAALAVGPCAGCGVVCLGCCRELDEDAIHKCSKCKWPLCSPTCSGVAVYTGHSAEECEVLAAISPDYGDLEDLKDSYHAVMPLRCLLLKSWSPSKWRLLSAMESHNGLRRARGDIWPTNQRLVVDRIRRWGLDYDEEEIHTVCGVLEVNAFEIGAGGEGGGGSARALYSGPHLMAHGCVPRTAHGEAAGPARVLTVRAAVPLRRGDLITACYAYTLQGTIKRREHLEHSKFFSCSCERCSDRTELGTFASAFRCPRCSARVLAASPTDARSPWSCDGGCGYIMPSHHVVMLIKRLTDELDSIDANDVGGFESFLHKYRNVLHTNHYLCLSAKHSLSQLYGKVHSHMIHKMAESELRRKVEVCRELMPVFDVLEPGLSRLRGITLYELHAPLMVLTTRDFEKKAISKENLRTRLKEIVGYLKEAALILGFECPQSSEGLMAAAARDALSKIRTWEQIIGSIS